MKPIYAMHLFDKHYLVSEGEQPEHQLEVLFALANLFNIRIIKGEKLVRTEMIRFTSSQLGERVPEPFYRGFPESVRQLLPDQLLFDQLVHYAVTYGFGHFSEAGHSLFEEQFERAAFKENAEIKEFSVITEEEAIVLIGESVANLLAGTRPLSDIQYRLVKEYVIDFGLNGMEIASKNTIVRLMVDTKNLELADQLSMSDVIRLVDEINYIEYHNNNIKKLNLKNQTRKFITGVINRIFTNGRVDIINCYEKKKLWNGLLHHIHYKAVSEEAQQFVDAMRGSENKSVYSEFERHMTEKNIKAAIEALKTGKGSAAVLRNMNYIISRCESFEDMQHLCDCIDTKNVIVLIQLLIQYSQRKGSAARNFAFTKHNMLKIHTETPEEQQRRKSVISEGQAAMLSKYISENLHKILKGRLGKVYIDPDMKNYALPIQETTSQGGFGVLTRGSKLKMPETKKIRAFTYWEKVNDIDLSVFGIADNGNRMEFSWRTMANNNSDAIVYSGDETSGYNGGSEYFDINFEEFRKMYPDMHYLIFCDNVYSDINFEKCFCKAGYMTRDVIDSGEIYEPKTVKSSFMINCDSTFAYLFGVDLQTNEFIWLNMARNGSMTVAGTTDMSFITDYFHVTDIINVYTFFEMMASEVVSDISEAEIIVTNKTVECAEGVEVIREYDVDKMIALMNK